MRNNIISAGIFAMAAMLFLQALSAQSIISGDITGTVTDPSGALLPNAQVSLRNLNTGTGQNTTTNGQGAYRFSLLQPGQYAVKVTAPGFQTAEQSRITVVAGQPTAANFQLAVASASETVVVSESAAVLQTENADVSTQYNTEQILDMPNPGGDLTYIAQTAPGVVMNTQSGYGNFSALGMPATSNLFTINGQNFNDPYLNLNNSGASNLMLGFNDISEGNVVNNAYSAQYGQYAGSQVTYITKSGTNDFHGDAIWMWNGRYLNANDFFSNSVGSPRPFLNFNQWATGVQGPIWKNHTFFDVDYEGVRVVLPTSSALIRIPSQEFQAATLANLNATGNGTEAPFYQKIFSIYNGAPGAASATPVATRNGGCGSFSGLGAGVPCALQFRTTPPNREREYQWAGRVDHNFSDKDRGYIRLWRDNGYQPTYTDALNPIFNAYSPQPQMSGQISETHTFGSTAVNQFNGSALFYSAAFLLSNPSASVAALQAPYSFIGAPFSRVGGESFQFPQGRRVFQYQIIDDLSKIVGKHTFRIGFSWLHDNVSELGFQENVNGWIHVASLQEFFNGGGPNSYIQQNFPTASEQPFAFNTFAGYLADDWKATDRLTVSLNLRLENYGNPTCGHNCFARLATPFTGAAADVNTPYNKSILYNQHNAYPDTPILSWEPRVGVAWRPGGSEKTVIRAGAGIFADEIPGNLAQAAAFNTPGLNIFTIAGGSLAPGVPGSLFTQTAQANQALLSQFFSGGTLASIQQAVPSFSPPSITSFPAKFVQPTYYKWNFEIQQALGWKTVLSVNYAGMHGIHIPIADGGLNAYCPTAVCPGGFLGLPTAPPDPRFGTVTQYLTAATSNYNGLTVSLQRRVSTGFIFNLNYTWSHALDMVSNGGLEPLSYLATNISILNPQNPYSVRANYGNADQDVRHYLSLGWVMTDAVRHAGMHWGPKAIFGDWTLSGNIFYRTGLPFTAIDGNATATLTGLNYLGTIFASPLTNHFASCDSKAVNVPCLNVSDFAASNSAPTSFGTAGRNTFRGPNFFDMDLALMKEFVIKERVRVSVGAQAFNLLNRPNFDQPVADIANPSFGTITALVGPPTSILGAFVGGNNSPRFVEVKASLRF